MEKQSWQQHNPEQHKQARDSFKETQSDQMAFLLAKRQGRASQVSSYSYDGRHCSQRP
jgi:hypothetical protein